MELDRCFAFRADLADVPASVAIAFFKVARALRSPVPGFGGFGVLCAAVAVDLRTIQNPVRSRIALRTMNINGIAPAAVRLYFLPRDLRFPSAERAEL